VQAISSSDGGNIKQIASQRFEAFEKHHTLVTPAGQKSVNATKIQAKHAQKHLLQIHSKYLIEIKIYEM